MKGLYVPPGRRKLNEESGIANEFPIPTPPPSIVLENHVKNNKDASHSVTVSSSEPVAERGIATKQGVYVPPGRRELEEKKAAEIAIEEEKKLLEEQKKREANKSASSGGALYVPRGRRELNEKRLAEQSSNDEEPPKRIAGSLFERMEANSKSTATTTAIHNVPSSSSVNSIDSTSSSNTFIPSDFDLSCSTVIVRGFPTNYSFLARDSFATQYTDKGATVRWLTNDQELLAVFRNEMTCLSELHSSSSYAFSITRLCDQTDNRDEYLRVARELIAGKKADRSNTVVANRLIGAALGIRMPASMVQSKASSSSSNNNSNKSRSSSPPRIDAWDD